jgi:hypothetical protein
MNTTKTGWRPIKAVDLRRHGNTLGRCQKCGRQGIRFLHTVAHEDSRQLEVGSECARNLCYGYDPEREEAKLKTLWTRRSNWLTRNWATSWKGNQTLTFTATVSTATPIPSKEEVRVTVFRDQYSGGYKVSIGVNKEVMYLQQTFATQDEAKLEAFDQIADALGWGI